MSTAVADPPSAQPAAPAAAAASAPAGAGSPAGAAAAGSGAGAAAVAPVRNDLRTPAQIAAEQAAAVKPAEAKAEPAKPAAETARKALLAEDAAPAKAEAKPEGEAKAEPAKPEPWTLEVPKDGPLAEADVKAVEAFAKAEGMSKAQAEKLLAREATGRAALAAQQKATVDGAWNQFATDAEKAFGAQLPATVAAAQRALIAHFTPEERKAIVASPLQNHPLFLKALARAAPPAEDTIHANHPTTGAPRTSAARDIYGDRSKKR
jgi:hypothetical protein